MPELPEMEHYRIELSKHLLDKEITGVQINREKSLNIAEALFKERVIGRKIIFVERRAKHLLFHLDNGRRLLLHLMLGGLIYLGDKEDRPSRNTQVEIEFASEEVLYFIGLRLGYLHEMSAREADEALSHLGPEPLGRKMNLELFKKLLKKRRGSLKTVLVNQDVISGIGNCYADEIAFAARLRPTVKVQNLGEEDLERLYEAMRETLSEMTEAGGYMELPLTRDDIVTGGANDRLKVYDREGEPCPRCADRIVREEMNGRKVFYSPGCQNDR